MSFQELKQKRAQAIANLVKAAESTSEKKSYGDDRMWAPTVDKAEWLCRYSLPSSSRRGRSPLGSLLGSWLQGPNWKMVHRKVFDFYRSTRSSK